MNSSEIVPAQSDLQLATGDEPVPTVTLIVPVYNEEERKAKEGGATKTIDQWWFDCHSSGFGHSNAACRDLQDKQF